MIYAAHYDTMHELIDSSPKTAAVARRRPALLLPRQTGASQAREGGRVMKRLHLHIVVGSLPEAITFYSGLFATRPCCAGQTSANWRVDEPPLNLGASVAGRGIGPAHLGIEVDTPADLQIIDRALHGAPQKPDGVPWEVSVRKQPVRKERPS